MKRGERFARLVCKAVDESGRGARAAIAGQLGMSPHQLHRRLHNATCFSADEIRRLLACLPGGSAADALVDYLLDGTRWVAAHRLPADATLETSDLWRATTRVVYEATDVQREIEAALLDGRIDHREAPTIRRQIADAERALITLREHLNRI